MRVHGPDLEIRRGVRTWRSLALLTLVALAGCASIDPQPEPQPEKNYGTYRTAPPDQLLVSVLPEPLLERTVVVRPDGMISFDLVGDIPASGRTLDEIAKEIEGKIGEYKRGARVTVALAGSLSISITLLGEVKVPSNFALDRDMRVVEALGRVGGTSIFASRSNARVIRVRDGQTTVIPIDIAAIERGDLRTNIWLMPGDVVYVPPTILARIGYAIAGLTFPFQALIGSGIGGIATTVIAP
jgi:polysaccharide export outer membrane protein